MKRLVVDIQGFKIENNKFIPKELAAYDGEKTCHYIFKPPFNIKHLSMDVYKQALWLIKNHHCISWQQGFTPVYKFGEIVNQIMDKADIVFVKGREKLDYVKNYTLKPVLELYENPALEPTSPKCFYHLKSPCICALTNVYYLYNNFLMNE